MSDKISILAVDDEPFNLDLIEAAFEKYENIEITNAVNGQEALDILETKEFDVVLLDISMPIMDGIEALDKIRANEKLKNLPIIIVTANSEREHDSIIKGASDFILKPYDIEIMCVRTINYAKINHFNKLEKTLKLAKQTECEISIRLGRASEFKDLETSKHIKRMSSYSKLLAELYGLDKEECELILCAAPLHDIGKVGIPDSILLKPGRFESNEFDIMKQHAVLGAKMLESDEQLPVLKAGHIIALEHHEKWDGSGYPHAKSGEDIHLYARIIAIADVFDALSSKRCYREPIPFEKVLNIMKTDAGTHFDPKLTQLFLDNLDKFLEIKERYKDDNTHTIMDIINGVKS